MHLQMVNASFVLIFAMALVLGTQRFVDNRAARVSAMHTSIAR